MLKKDNRKITNRYFLIKFETVSKSIMQIMQKDTRKANFFDERLSLVHRKKPIKTKKEYYEVLFFCCRKKKIISFYLFLMLQLNLQLFLLQLQQQHCKQQLNQP